MDNTSEPVSSTLAAVERACSRIAPVWPLDQFIAVNPWWGLVDMPFEAAAATLASLSGATMHMQPSYFRERLAQLPEAEDLIETVLDEQPTGLTPAQARAWLDGDDACGVPRVRLMTDLLDAQRDLVHHVSWAHAVTHQVSQFCASCFDRGQALWSMKGEEPLYGRWRRLVVHERGIGVLSATDELPALFNALPDDEEPLLEQARSLLGIPCEGWDAYLHALLLSVNGWASWCAWLRWQARLKGGDDGNIRGLLAIRLGWEITLHRLAAATQVDTRRLGAHASTLQQRAEEAQAPAWAWQAVLERAYQRQIANALASPAPARAQHPEVQAAFCIDVRSEVFRRAFESVSPSVQTLGFAGFFGVPLAYEPAGEAQSSARLPGLLAPRLVARDVSLDPGVDAGEVARGRQRQFVQSRLRRRVQTGSASAFANVEATGLFYGFKLLKDGLLGGKSPAAKQSPLKPRLVLQGDAREQKAELAATVLRAMSLTRDFAPIVLLVGHGGRSDNNPHQAGLDCGACCGQAGDVNARVLAAVLNEPGVRDDVRTRGIDIPAATHFVPALHVTTTDDVVLFDLDEVPQVHAGRIAEVQDWLAQAGDRARRERASRLGLAAASPALPQELRRRSHNWCETRPEWALANNAAFIAAPRHRTAHLNLDGRAFLHDYTWQDDAGFPILELIMTAPMVVAHWINLQYYASTVDNLRYGSGNKVLHNVVGGSIGVFEGNGGDLRIGLPMQSLHDGQQWMHEPLRLNVVIEAPREAIDSVISRHGTVRNLVLNRWLHLFALDSDTRQLWQRGPHGWACVPTGLALPAAGAVATEAG